MLLVAGSSSEIYQIDLEAGQHLAPIESPNLSEVNHTRINPTMPLYACAGNSNVVEFWDMRASYTKPVAVLQNRATDDGNAVGSFRDYTGAGSGATCIDFSPSGMHLAVGSSEGKVNIFDIRSKDPVLTRDHKNGLPIRSVKYQTETANTHANAKYVNTATNTTVNGSGNVVLASCDAKAIKIWNAATSSNGSRAASNSDGMDGGAEEGKLFTAIEAGDGAFNDVEFYPNSGLLFATGQGMPRIGVYFLPTLGVAPKWCSFLDSMTEELAETAKSTIYDSFQFVSKEVLEQLHAEDLLGTKYLQPYMHGYFMDAKLYQKLKAASEPFKYEEYLHKQKLKEIDAKKPMRVTTKTHADSEVAKKIQANKALHDKLARQIAGARGDLSSKKSKKAGGQAKAVLQDDRFKSMFENPDFEIEEVKGDGGLGEQKDGRGKKKRVQKGR